MESGLSIEQFWGYSPREIDVYLRAEKRKRAYERELMVFHAWHVALFERQNTLPKLDKILGSGSSDDEREIGKKVMNIPEQTPEEIFEWAISFTKMMGGKIIKRGEEQSLNP